LKILWIKANKLLPVHSGGDIRSYHIVRELGRNNAVTFFSYYDGKPDSNYERALSEELPGSVSVCTGKGEGTAARALDYVTRVGSGSPYAVSRFECRKVQEKLKEWFANKSFDVAVCDFLDAAINLPHQLTIPTVLFQHNVESEIWRRHAETESNAWKRWLYSMEFRKMQQYEKETVAKFNHVVAVSEHDRQLMAAWIARDKITVVPTGVAGGVYKPDPAVNEEDSLVAFTGAMDWAPNIDAVEYFCREIWPAVLGVVPSARFRIVGRNPDRRVEKLASAAIEVTGRVPSVVDHLRKAAVVVVPLRIGGGTRLKIYEAMATGKAVVSTSVGAEGLDVHDGRDILLANDASAFAQAVANLLLNRQVRQAYGRAALELASKFDWRTVGQKFGGVLSAVLGSATSKKDYAYSGEV